jgi:hypothetical protein
MMQAPNVRAHTVLVRHGNDIRVFYKSLSNG